MIWEHVTNKEEEEDDGEAKGKGETLGQKAKMGSNKVVMDRLK